MRLISILSGLPADEVRKIAETHGLPEDTGGERLTQLLAQSRTLLNSLRVELRPVTNLIERLAVFGGSADLDADIMNGLPVSRLAAAHAKGLLFLLPSAADPRRVVLPLEYALMREIKRPPATDLLSGLRVLGVDHARLMARILEQTESRATPILLGDLHDRLLEGASDLADALSPGERGVLDGLLERGGVMDTGAMHREHPLVPSSTAGGPFSVPDLFGLGRHRGRPTDAQRLVQKGLVHLATEKDAPGGTVTRVFVPAELVERLSGAWAKRHAAAEDKIREQAVLRADPERIRPAVADVARSLRAFALAVEALGYGFIRGGQPRRDHVDAISRLLPLSGRDQELLAELGRMMGVFGASENRLTVAPDAATCLDRPSAEFLAELRESITRESGLADPLRPRFRRIVIHRLGRYAGEWFRVTALPDLARTDAEYRRTVAVQDLDPDTESAELLGILEELRTWGFVDLAGDSGAVTAVRFKTPGTPSDPEPPERPFTIPPNLEVVVPLAAPFGILADLCRIADPKLLDLAAVFTLSEASLLRGVVRGCPLGEARAFLAAHCAHSLPAAVEQLFDDVAAREGEIRVLRTSGVLTLKDTELGEALQEHPEIGPLILAPLAPGVFALDPTVDPDTVVDVLKKHGFFAMPG